MRVQQVLLIHIDLDKSGYFVFNAEQVLLLLRFTQCDEKWVTGEIVIKLFLISNFFALFWMWYAFFWVIPPASEFYMRTFQNTLFRLHRQVGMKNSSAYEDGTDSVPKHRHIKFRHGGITPMKWNCLLVKFTVHSRGDSNAATFKERGTFGQSCLVLARN